jgi:hypothetical protein
VATPGEARAAVIALTDRQDADVRRAWARIRQAVGLDPIRARNALAQVLPAIGDTYGSAASALAADIYDGGREAAGVRDRRGRRFRATAAPLADQGRYDALAGWAVGPLFGSDPDPDAVASKLAGGMQRTTADAYRETITENTKRDPNAIGWRRIGHGNTCEFCRMLINRGAVYTEETAKFRAHDNCKCTAAAAFKGEDIGPLDPAAMGLEADELSPIEAEFLRVQGEDRPQYVKTMEFMAESDYEHSRSGLYTKFLAEDRQRLLDFEDAIKSRRKELRTVYGLEGNEYRRVLRSDSILAGYRDRIKDIKARITDYEKQIADTVRRAEEKLAQAKTWEARATVFRKGPPIEIEAAAKGTNMNWHNGLIVDDMRYDVNCTRCATAYEMRRRGYDVIARGVQPWESISKNSGYTLENFREKSGAIRKPLDPTGRIETEAIIATWPVGARGFISGAWRSGGGHIWNVERTKDGYIFVESQVGRASGIKQTDAEWSELEPDSILIARVDDLVPTDYVGAFVEAK